MMRLAIAVAVFFSALPNVLAAEDSVGRFQLMDNAPVVVIDTATGQLWFATGNIQEGYIMRQMCYLRPNGQLMPTPYEDKFVDDLERYKGLCPRTR